MDINLDGALFGIETEYGILVEGAEAHDLVEESRLLVRSCDAVIRERWDYEREDPRRDLRGYRVNQLNYNRRDALLDRGGPSSALSSAEQRADQVTASGGRFYNDHGHPEWATPECRSLKDLAAQDRAGELLVLECAHRRSEATGRQVRIYKNNTDYHGAAYGCHESYLFPREVPFEHLLAGMLPFLCTRALFAGAGKVGAEDEARGDLHGGFQLTQRADFFSAVASVDTLAQRPIFNTRDEPHADPTRHRRVHVICGDANLSQWATAMKVGAARLVLALIETGWQPLIALANPVEALQAVSRCSGGKALLELQDGRTFPALEIQRIYLGEIERAFPGVGGEWGWVLKEWRRVLDDLERDPMRAADRVDWAAKLKLFQQFVEAEGCAWSDPLLPSLDLEYHDIDPARGFVRALEDAGEIETLVTESAAVEARTQPPTGARAAARCDLMNEFGDAVAAIGWQGAWVSDAKGERWIELPVETGLSG